MSMIGNFYMTDEATAKRLMAQPQEIESLLYPDDERDSDARLDIDKTWNIIHFLLTGDVLQGAPPHRDVILGGEPIGDHDVGYGPARLLWAAEVKKVSDLLAGLPAPELLKNFDVEAVASADVYPGWTGDSEDIEYITQYYEELRGFYAEAAQRSYCVIQYIS